MPGPYLLVGGGREYRDAARVASVLDDAYNTLVGPATLVSAADEGASDLAQLWAIERRIPRVVWTKADPPLALIDVYRPSLAVIFPGDMKTADLVRRLFYARIETRIVGDVL